MIDVQCVTLLGHAVQGPTLARAKTDRRRRRGHAVLSARETRGWTLEECAESSGFSVRQITEWEHGSRGLTIESLCRLARGYGMKQEEVTAIVMGGGDEVESGAEQIR